MSIKSLKKISAVTAFFHSLTDLLSQINNNLLFINKLLLTFIILHAILWKKKIA